MICPSALSQLNMDPIQPMAAEGDGASLTDFPAAAIDFLVAVAGPDAETPPTSVEVRQLGRALARRAPAGGAQPNIDARYLLNAVGATPTPDLTGPVRAHAQAVKDALAPWHSSYADTRLLPSVRQDSHSHPDTGCSARVGEWPPTEPISHYSHALVIRSEVPLCLPVCSSAAPPE
jgi:hypothetical protein